MNVQVRAPIDPRIRQRRVEVIRQQGRRRLHVLVVTTAVAVLAVGGWAATRSPLLDVDSIEVSGPPGSDGSAVVAASAIRYGEPLVDVDEWAAQERVAALPWVRSASVARHWPSTVTIEVTPRLPVAAVSSSGGGWALVDSNGQVVALSEDPDDLPQLTGIAPAGPPGSLLDGSAAGVLRVAASAPPDLQDRLQSVSPGAEGDVQLLLKAGGTVRLGQVDRLEEKFRSALAVLTRVDTHDLATLDVRIPQSPVLTRLNPVATVSTLGAG